MATSVQIILSAESRRRAVAWVQTAEMVDGAPVWGPALPPAEAALLDPDDGYSLPLTIGASRIVVMAGAAIDDEAAAGADVSIDVILPAGSRSTIVAYEQVYPGPDGAWLPDAPPAGSAEWWAGDRCTVTARAGVARIVVEETRDVIAAPPQPETPEAATDEDEAARLAWHREQQALLQ